MHMATFAHCHATFAIQSELQKKIDWVFKRAKLWKLATTLDTPRYCKKLAEFLLVFCKITIFHQSKVDCIHLVEFAVCEYCVQLSRSAYGMEIGVHQPHRRSSRIYWWHVNDAKFNHARSPSSIHQHWQHNSCQCICHLICMYNPTNGVYHLHPYSNTYNEK